MMIPGNGMTADTLYRLAPALIALQLLAFGWSVNREISLRESERAIWVSVPDVINILSLFATVICVVVVPMATGSDLWLSRMVLAGGYILIAFHPLTVAAHYRLWSREGGNAPAYATRVEIVSAVLSIGLAVGAALCVGVRWL